MDWLMDFIYMIYMMDWLRSYEIKRYTQENLAKLSCKLQSTIF